MSLKDKLTIVIPCKNEGLTVKTTLQLLNCQKGIEGVSVIVADASDDYELTRNLIMSENSKKVLIKIIDGGFPAFQPECEVGGAHGFDARPAGKRGGTSRAVALIKRAVGAAVRACERRRPWPRRCVQTVPRCASRKWRCGRDPFQPGLRARST